MKNTIRFFVITFVMFVFLTKLSGQFDERMERFQAQRVAYFTEKMQLTPQEAERFWPVYNDYTNRKNKLEEESRNILKFLSRNSANMAERELLESMNNYIQLQEKIQQPLTEYHKEYLKLLPPQKVAMIYATETQYRNFLLNQIRDNRQERAPRRF